MSEEEARGKPRSSARLPATLLLILIVLISGAVLWLTAEPPPEKPEPPKAELALTPAPAGKSAPVPEAHPPTTDRPVVTVAAPPAEEQVPLPQKPAPAAAATHGADAKPTTPEAATTPAPPAQGALPQGVEESPAAQQPTAEHEPPAAHAAEPAPHASTPEKPTPAKTAETEMPAPAAKPEATADRPETPRADPSVVEPPKPATPKLPKLRRSAPLTAAPDPEIVEETPRGPLPVVGRDGREAWRVYARPFDPEDKRPRIATIIYGLGSSAAATRSAIQGLPGTITLAFTPYADQLPSWMAAARAAGHEALLMVPMEPNNYPNFDPGPQALLTSLSDRENVERLEWMLGRGVGYVGVVSFMGSRFTGSTRHLRMFLQNLKKRSLLFVESETGSNAMAMELATSIKLPFAANRLYIDGRASRAAIDSQLRESERLAQRLGSAVIMGFPYPVTLERIAEWAAAVEQRGFALAPVSALAVRKEP